MDFCTYFDRDYLARGLILLDSIICHCGPSARIWVLALDSFTGAFLRGLNISALSVIELGQLEAQFSGLRAARENRSRVEYYWTLSPFLPYYLLYVHPRMATLCYLDADMALFSSGDDIWRELGPEAAALLVPHDYSEDLSSLAKSGRYNVGVIVYNSVGARACLEWWRSQCLDWCHGRHEDGKFGDQGYLDEWPDRFRGITVSRRPAISAAPWNAGKWRLYRNTTGMLMIGGEPLVAYHFHGIRPCVGRLVQIAGWPVELSREWIEWVYRPYVNALLSVEKWASRGGVPIRSPRSGLPLRYTLGRLLKRQPLRHFLVAKTETLNSNWHLGLFNRE